MVSSLSLTCRQLSEAEVLHRACGDQGLLRVPEDMGQGVHADMEIGDVDTHGLLAHGGLVGVPGRLVVIREGDDGSTNTLEGKEKADQEAVNGLSLLLEKVVT